MERVERVLGGIECVLVTRHEGTERIRREDLVLSEVAPREGGLAGAGSTDQHDEAELGDSEDHDVNTAICVGAPRSASTSPMGTKRTAKPRRSATPRANASNSARVHSNRWSACRIRPGGR